jgi:hypothetical protein
MRAKFPRFVPVQGVVLCVASLVAAAGAPLVAQAVDSVRVVPGPQYQVSLPLAFLGARVFGARYRDAWTTPTTLPAFDPSRVAGGLAVAFADTGLYAGFTYLRDRRGGLWTFRTGDLNLSALLPQGMREQAVTEALEDLGSALLPGAPLVANPLAEAVGVRVPETRFVAWDTTVGYLRRGIETPYLDQLGAPDGSITTTRLLERMITPGAIQVDTSQYLRERLFDIYVGHWDLGPQSWRWTPDGETGWTPAPRNREAAFARYDGLLTLFIATGLPSFTVFGDAYKRKLGITSQEQVVDRRILIGLPDSAWQQAAASMRARLTDAVIREAVSRLPEPGRARYGADLEARLRRRRDELAEAADKFRLIVLNRAEVYGTSGGDSVAVSRGQDGALQVQVGHELRQRFDPQVTSYVHLYLMGGPDTVVVGGQGKAGPVLRVAGTPGMAITDSSRARFDIYSPKDVEKTGPGRAHRRPRTLTVPRVADSLYRDMPPLPGAQYAPVIWLDINSDLGLFLGGGVTRTSYRPDYLPFQDRMRIRAGWGTTPMAGAIEFAGQWRLSPNRGSSAILDVEYSGIKVLNFFGYGNETVRDPDQEDRYYKAGQTQVVFAPGLRLPLGAVGRVDVAVIYKNVYTTNDTTRFIIQQDPYGVDESFDQLGGRIALSLDTRDHPLMASRGLLVQAATTLYAASLDEEDPFGSVQASLAGAHTPGGFQSLTIAARASGFHAWGQFPVHEAAFIGGSSTLRSHQNGRFAGESSLYGNLDARLRVTTIPLILRLDAGIYGLADAGRVFVEGESSKRWHYSAGGGLWLATADRSLVGRMEIASGDDGIGFRFGTGFKF